MGCSTSTADMEPETDPASNSTSALSSMDMASTAAAASTSLIAKKPLSQGRAVAVRQEINGVAEKRQVRGGRSIRHRTISSVLCVIHNHITGYYRTRRAAAAS